ncbi:two-component regulator propeller domain-containing protein [Massilia sp. W12]|uniref:sensor histidine kinase n=1 Tax=Massilia sp. W12 TaxID=3126507 RepID=UPI0030D20E57
MLQTACLGRTAASCVKPWLAWLLLFACCICTFSAHATRWGDSSATVFHHIGSERGLPHPIVTALQESEEGFLWVGTQGGLARWDGMRFRTYQHYPKDPYSLPDVWVQALHRDRKGRLWVATYEGGVAQYDAMQDRFERVAVGPGGLSHHTVWAIADDGDGGLFFGTDSGLDQYMPDTGGMRHWQHNPNESGSLPDNHVYAIVREKSGVLWLGTGRGLARRKPGASQFEEILMPGGPAMVRSLLLASDGSLWVGTRRNGIFVRPPASAGKEPAFLPFQEYLRGGSEALLKKEWARDIKEVAPGEIWIGSDSGGLLQVSLSSRHMRRISHDLRVQSSLSDDSVNAILRDRSGLLWVGTRAGLNRHDPHSRAFISIFGGSSMPGSISDPNLWTVFPASDGRIWFGLGSKGVDIFDPERGLVGGIRPDPARPERALPQELVLSLAQAGPDQYLIGTGQGLYMSDAKGGNVQRMALPGSGGQAEVRSMLRVDDKIWIGTSNDGLWQYDLAQNGNYLQRISTDWLAEQRINVIEPGPQGRLWLAGRDSLILFDPVSRKVEKIKPNPGDPHALASTAITSMQTDRQGRLWVATFGAGINVLEKRDADGIPYFRRFSTTEGLPHANVNRLLIDGRGRIWASTDDGLAMIEPGDYSVRRFQSSDGVPLSSYWARSGAVSQQGELLFGASGGLTIVRPDLLQDWTYEAPLLLTDLRVGGKPVLANRFNQKRATEPLQILPEGNSLSVEFASLDFSAPERNRYAYRLRGYENDWIETDSSRRLAAYTNLPPGDYVLEIRASNRNGHWLKQPFQLPLKVLPAWHQTLWFLLLEILLGLAAVYALLQIRTRYMRQYQHQLESQVSLRTAEMQNYNQHLQQANAELAQSAEILRLLGEVGRDITANLEADAVFAALHRHVGGLLDTSVMVIYRTSSDGSALESGFGREDNQILPTFRVLLDSPSSNAARAGRERREILLERKAGETQALPISGSRMLTSLYAPLIVGQRLLGVMSIQSRHEHAYGEKERMIFRTLCSYGAIALANAESLQALHQAQAQLVQQEKLAALGGLVAGVAHEVNTPIGNAMLALSGNNNAWQKLDASLNHGSLSKTDLLNAIGEGLEYTGLALQNIKRAAALITSFQGIAVSFESDQADELDLARYLPDVAGLVHADFEQFGHTLEVDVEEGLRIRLVSAALTEVLSRILANVLDHAFASGRPGKVVLSAQRNQQSGMIDIKVADNGQGIPAEALPKIFDPFYTSMSGSGGHVGLGLHVVYNHVTHRLHGRIKAESSLGHGSVFTISLPPHPPGSD